jgi:hypothetical protein
MPANNMAATMAAIKNRIRGFRFTAHLGGQSRQLKLNTEKLEGEAVQK